MDLSEVRVLIDSVDKELKELFLKRMALSKEVAGVKRETGDVVYKPDREAAMICDLSGDIPEEIRDDYVEFLKNILWISRKYQYRLLDIPEDEWK